MAVRLFSHTLLIAGLNIPFLCPLFISNKLNRVDFNLFSSSLLIDILGEDFKEICGDGNLL
jgi:hypothetical protein